MAENKEILRQYQPAVAFPTIFLTLVILFLYVVVSISTIQGYFSSIYAVLLNSLFAYILFTCMHEASHYNISGESLSLKWLNEAFGWLSGITLLAPFYLFRVIHFRHHAFTNDPVKDPDHWLASTNFFSLLYHATTVFPIYIIKGILLLYSNEKIPKKIKRELRISFIVLIIFTLLFVLLGINFGWMIVIQIWILPAFIAQSFLAITFDWLPHHPHEKKGRYTNTRIIDIPCLSILFLAQNYHLIHHLYPGIPFYNYKKTYLDLKDELEHQDVEIISFDSKKSS